MTYYIVWNDTRTEGFITDSMEDAVAASTYGGSSSAGLNFFELYGGNEQLEIQEISL